MAPLSQVPLWLCGVLGTPVYKMIQLKAILYPEGYTLSWWFL